MIRDGETNGEAAAWLICDHATILGLQERGRRVIFVEDAARGLDETRTAACLADWRDRGVIFSTVDGVLSLI